MLLVADVQEQPISRREGEERSREEEDSPAEDKGGQAAGQQVPEGAGCRQDLRTGQYKINHISAFLFYPSIHEYVYSTSLNNNLFFAVVLEKCKLYVSKYMFCRAGF